jgi:hypothetical protein
MAMAAAASMEREIISCFAADLMMDCIESCCFVQKNEAGEVEDMDVETLEGRILGIYYSASHLQGSGPIHERLAQKYNEIVGAGHQFEIIFVSGDDTEEESEEFSRRHPWKLLKFDEEYANNGFKDLFEFGSKPAMVLLDEHFRLLTNDGINVLETHEFSFIRYFLWDIDSIPEYSTKSSQYTSTVCDSAPDARAFSSSPLVHYENVGSDLVKPKALRQ